MVELWDIYDINRKKTGRIHERGRFLNKGEYHIVVNIWIMNKNKEVLLTKRHPNKSWGDYWECTCGSVVRGETSIEGAIREVKEETGITLNSSDGILLREDRKREYFIDTWLFKKDINLSEIILQKDEVIDVRLVNKEKYEKMNRAGIIVPLIGNFYELYSDIYNEEKITLF